VQKDELWKKIAETMTTECPDLQLSGLDCDRKWRILIQTFRKISDKKKTGHGSVHWKFYGDMQMVTKDRASSYSVLSSSSHRLNQQVCR